MILIISKTSRKINNTSNKIRILQKDHDVLETIDSPASTSLHHPHFIGFRGILNKGTAVRHHTWWLRKVFTWYEPGQRLPNSMFMGKETADWLPQILVYVQNLHTHIRDPNIRWWWTQLHSQHRQLPGKCCYSTPKYVDSSMPKLVNKHWDNEDLL